MNKLNYCFQNLRTGGLVAANVSGEGRMLCSHNGNISSDELERCSSSVVSYFERIKNHVMM